MILRSPEAGDLLIGKGPNNFTLGGGANNNLAVSQPSIGGNNMEVTTVGGVTRYGFAGYHGAFQSNINQTLTAAATPTLVRYEVTDLSYGVSVASNPSGPANTRIKVNNAGVYNFQFSIQVVAAVNNSQAYFWLKKNGADVTSSNTEIDLPNKDYGYVAAWNFLVALNANEYVELSWSATDSGAYLRDGTPAAGYGPQIPSVIATMVLVR
jgi:hypothetical protein